jgi:hypothetical protein
MVQSFSIPQRIEMAFSSEFYENNTFETFISTKKKAALLEPPL